MSQTATQTLSLAETAPSLSLSGPSSPKTPFQVNFNYYLPPPDGPGIPSTNDLELILGTKDQEIRCLPVHNLRGREHEFSLDKNGFCVVRHESAEKTFEDNEHVLKVYYPEIEDIVRKQYPNLTSIHHLGHIIRSALPRTDFSGSTDAGWNKPDRGCAPAPRAYDPHIESPAQVHIDFTREGLCLVLSQTFPDATVASLTERLGHRYLALSIWRPIKTVTRDPLGYMDGRTVDPKGDLVPLRRVYPDGKETENLVVKGPSADTSLRHDWYWISDQQPNEVVMLKLFDSDETDLAKGWVGQTPHSSFHVDGTEGNEARQSVEIRVVVGF